MSALQQLGAASQVRERTTDPTVSRTPTVAGHPARQEGSDEEGSDEGMLRAVSVWLGESGITLPSPKWLSMMRSEAEQRIAMASRVNIALPSRPFVSGIFGGTVLLGRRDARSKVCVSLADFFDVERNPATILSRCFAEFWEQCLFWPECEEQWILWEAKRAPVFVE